MSKTLSELKKLQKNFDQTHVAGNKPLYSEITEENIHDLMNLAVCLSGEVGEFCNILKKSYRGDFSLSQAKPHLSEELADVLIYILKISNQFDIDIEQETIKKINKNKLRFKKA